MGILVRILAAQCTLLLILSQPPPTVSENVADVKEKSVPLADQIYVGSGRDNAFFNRYNYYRYIRRLSMDRDCGKGYTFARNSLHGVYVYSHLYYGRYYYQRREYTCSLSLSMGDCERGMFFCYHPFDVPAPRKWCGYPSYDRLNMNGFSFCSYSVPNPERTWRIFSEDIKLAFKTTWNYYAKRWGFKCYFQCVKFRELTTSAPTSSSSSTAVTTPTTNSSATNGSSTTATAATTAADGTTAAPTTVTTTTATTTAEATTTVTGTTDTSGTTTTATTVTTTTTTLGSTTPAPTIVTTTAAPTTAEATTIAISTTAAPTTTTGTIVTTTSAGSTTAVPATVTTTTATVTTTTATTTAEATTTAATTTVTPTTVTTTTV